MKRAVTLSPPVSIFDLSLGPSPPFFGFVRGNEARAHQAREVGRMTISVGGGEGLDRRSAMEVGEDARDGIDECALAVCAGAPEEEQRVLAGRAGERIAAHALQVLLQRPVAAGNAIKEGTPQRTGVLAGRDCGYAG